MYGSTAGQSARLVVRSVNHTYILGRLAQANTDPVTPGPLQPGTYQFVLTLNGEFVAST